MATDKESMAYARERVRLAELTDEPEIRDQLFALASEWTVCTSPTCWSFPRQSVER
jgi:hypothetical protein